MFFPQKLDFESYIVMIFGSFYASVTKTTRNGLINTFMGKWQYLYSVSCASLYFIIVVMLYSGNSRIRNLLPDRKVHKCFGPYSVLHVYNKDSYSLIACPSALSI